MARTAQVPKGRLKTLPASGSWTAGLSRPFGTDPVGPSNPALKRWAILIGPFGTRSDLNSGARSVLGAYMRFPHIRFQNSQQNCGHEEFRLAPPHTTVHPTAFFQIGTVRFISSMRNWHAANASPRWGATTSTQSDGSPTFTTPRRWTSRTDSIGQRLSIS